MLLGRRLGRGLRGSFRFRGLLLLALLGEEHHQDGDDKGGHVELVRHVPAPHVALERRERRKRHRRQDQRVEVLPLGDGGLPVPLEEEQIPEEVTAAHQRDPAYTFPGWPDELLPAHPHHQVSAYKQRDGGQVDDHEDHPLTIVRGHLLIEDDRLQREEKIPARDQENRILEQHGSHHLRIRCTLQRTPLRV